jgi:hypothetical protein
MVAARPLGRTESAAAMAFWGNFCFLFCALILSAVFGTAAGPRTSHPSLALSDPGWVCRFGLDLPG